MTQKISFEISDAQIVDERNDSQFARLVIDAFASGDNRHNLIVSESTLRKAAHTIYQKPLIWSYNRIYDDIDTHSPYTVPCGFVTSKEQQFKTLDDGRVMMTVEALIWKRYSSLLMDILKRDNGIKSVSVEIEVFEMDEFENKKGGEILDFVFAAICFLGEQITPAIPNAKAEVVKFAKEYQEAFKQEFSGKYDDLDFTIPPSVKKNAQDGLNFFKQYNRGGTSVALASARFLVKNAIATPQKVKSISKYFSGHSIEKTESNGQPTDETIAWLLWGGMEGKKWSLSLAENIDAIDKKRMSYFENAGDNNNKDTEDLSMDESGNVKPEEGEEEPKDEAMMEAPAKDQTATDESKEEKEEKDFEQSEKPEEGEKGDGDGDEGKQEPDGDEAEKPEDKSEDKPEEGDDKKDESGKEDMSLNENVDLVAMLTLLQQETETNRDVIDEIGKPEGERNYSKIVCGLFAFIKKLDDGKKELASKFEEASAKNETFSAEIEILKKFKADVEQEKFAYEVEATLVECADVMPKDRLEVLREDAKNYSLETVDAWKNKAKAEAFTFAKDKKPDGINRIGLPFNNGTKKNDSLWK